MNTVLGVLVVLALLVFIGGAKKKSCRSSQKRPERTTFYEPTKRELKILEKEKIYRKTATALKREKRYIDAVNHLRLARAEQYKTSLWYDIDTLLRIPKYLILAKRYTEAIREAKDILEGKWKFCGSNDRVFRNLGRQHTFEVIAEAYSKMGNKNMALRYSTAAQDAELNRSADHVHEIIKEFQKTYRELGTDIGEISSCGCSSGPCVQWHGKIISVLGKTQGFPTLSEVDVHALFNSDTYHSVCYVDETIDRDKIKKQRRS